MIIVAGHLTVAPEARTAYVEGCRSVVEAARHAPGCLEFAISADPVDPGRVLVLERWESRWAVESFRGNGPSGEQTAAILEADVAEYDVASGRSLTG